MAADVSSLVRVMNGVDMNEQTSAVKSTAPIITRDFLGGSYKLDAKELDLDLQVPYGWEKRLDLKSGEVYLQICKSSSIPNSKSSSLHQNYYKSHLNSNLQDHNYFPPPSKKLLTLDISEDVSLGLKLDVVQSPKINLSSNNTTTPTTYQSVCTLDKVKSALERAEKETLRKRSISVSQSSDSPLSNSSSTSFKDDYDHVEKSTSSVASFAAGCPSCLLYVLISKNNPKCPRCNSVVPMPMDTKKPRIDLNMSI